MFNFHRFKFLLERGLLESADVHKQAQGRLHHSSLTLWLVGPTANDRRTQTVTHKDVFAAYFPVFLQSFRLGNFT